MPMQGAFKKVSGQGRGPLVPEKRQAVDEARGRGRPRPILERAQMPMTNDRIDASTIQPLDAR